MKQKVSIHHLLWLLVGLNAYCQGTFVYDQQSSDENNLQEGGSGIQQSQPLGQSFTPSLATVGFIRLYIYDASTLNTTPGDVVVQLRSGSITGAILGVSPTVTLPDNFGGPVNFTFTDPIAVTPGVTYFFQLALLNNNSYGVSRSPFYSYAGGTAFVSGVADPPSDLWFREGIVVPEPSAMAILLAGAVVAAWRQRGRRNN